MATTSCPSVDVFQASLINMVQEASDIGIQHFFETKKSELNRFMLFQYIRSLYPSHPLRSKVQQYPLSSTQSLSFLENDSATESALKQEWGTLLSYKPDPIGSPRRPRSAGCSLALQTTTGNSSTPYAYAQPPPSRHQIPLELQMPVATQMSRRQPQSQTQNSNQSQQLTQSMDGQKGEADEEQPQSHLDEVGDGEPEPRFTYRSISRSCWIYIVQEFCLQSDKLASLPLLNHFFNDLVSDRLVWRELALSAHQINVSIRHQHYSAFELFLSRSCTNLQTLDFECLAKDQLSWDTLWSLLSRHCLTLKHIHIGLYDGIWKFEFNQLKPICEDLFRNVQRHVVPTSSLPGHDHDADDAKAASVKRESHGDALRESANYLPITRIECAPGVMPTHIVSLLKRARVLEHFFVPLIYNDGDDRWCSRSFWEIPATLPSTLKSFRGFDAQTPLRFVHACISNLPNIEEFHVVLYFGSAHPDFIACSMTSATLSHLASHCTKLRSFEGYFHSTDCILEGIEAMVVACRDLELIGLLFHPDVADEDIDQLIVQIGESAVCRQPMFSRLTENPNQHVQLRVVEIGFRPRAKYERQLSHGATPRTSSELTVHDAFKTPERNSSEQTGPYAGFSGKHIKSLDEIDSDDADDEEDIDIEEEDEEQELFDGHADLSDVPLDYTNRNGKRRNGDHNSNRRATNESRETVEYSMSQSGYSDRSSDENASPSQESDNRTR